MDTNIAHNPMPSFGETEGRVWPVCFRNRGRRPLRPVATAPVGGPLTSGCAVIKDYLRKKERRGCEKFVRPTHPPGQAQTDLSAAMVIIGRSLDPYYSGSRYGEVR